MYWNLKMIWQDKERQEDWGEKLWCGKWELGTSSEQRMGLHTWGEGSCNPGTTFYLVPMATCHHVISLSRKWPCYARTCFSLGNLYFFATPFVENIRTTRASKALWLLPSSVLFLGANLEFEPKSLHFLFKISSRTFRGSHVRNLRIPKMDMHIKATSNPRLFWLVQPWYLLFFCVYQRRASGNVSYTHIMNSATWNCFDEYKTCFPSFGDIFSIQNLQSVTGFTFY